MATRTKRIELRADPESEARIAQAAALERVSVSAFVLRAADDAASRVLGRSDHTPMPAVQFDALVASLDTPDRAPRLRAAARRRRRYERS